MSIVTSSDKTSMPMENTSSIFFVSLVLKHGENPGAFNTPGDESERSEYLMQQIHLKMSVFVIYLLPPLSLDCSSTELCFRLHEEEDVLTQRGASKVRVCVHVCVRTSSYFRTYTSNVGTVRIGRRKLDSFIRGGKKCRGSADGRHDFYIWEFLLAGPVRVVPICPDLPIHFLGPLWCQKTNRLCIWSLVINSWMRSIAWTDMNQAEQRIKRCFLSSLSHATGSTFFHYSVWIPSPTPHPNISTYLFLAWEYPSAITAVTCLCAVDEVWEHSAAERKSLLN